MIFKGRNNREKRIKGKHFIPHVRGSLAFCSAYHQQHLCASLDYQRFDWKFHLNLSRYQKKMIISTEQYTALLNNPNPYVCFQVAP